MAVSLSRDEDQQLESTVGGRLHRVRALTIPAPPAQHPSRGQVTIVTSRFVRRLPAEIGLLSGDETSDVPARNETALDRLRWGRSLRAG